MASKRREGVLIHRISSFVFLVSHFVTFVLQKNTGTQRTLRTTKDTTAFLNQNRLVYL